MTLRSLLLASLFWVLVGEPICAADWPMSGFDGTRSSSSPHELPAKLYLHWVREYPPLKPAWPDQAKMQFDAVYDPIVVGKTMYVVSSRWDCLTALDTVTGAEKWRFFTDGPIRFAPAAWDNRLYFTADDGYLYCVGAARGNLHWKFRGGPSDRKILGNERVISTWPARGAPVVADGIVYFAASIWPFMGIFVHALDAQTGNVLWTNDGDGSVYIKQPHGTDSFAGIAPQGRLVISGDKLLLPGGRSVPACFDRKTGKMLRYQLGENGKRGGGSEVVATSFNHFSSSGEKQAFFFNGGAAFDLVSEKYLGEIGSPVVLSGNILFSYAAGACRAYNLHSTGAWAPEELASCKTPVVENLIKAGSRLYGGTMDQVFGIDLAANGRDMHLGWARNVEGTVARLLAADDRLFAVTREGRIYCFGANAIEETRHPMPQIALEPEDGFTRQAKKVLDSTRVSEGYAIVWGVGNGRLLTELARQSKLQVLGIDPDERKIQNLRAHLQADDLYGHRIALLAGDPHTIDLPPYLASLMVLGDLPLSSLDGPALAKTYASLRPYGGVFCLAGANARDLARQVGKMKLEQAEVREVGKLTLLFRQGALPGSANWTHEHADAANTRVSKDQLVKAPLGVLWFGGPSHEGILPRHGHGPQPQVVDGRLIIEGVDMIRAMDIYTGRLLWETPLPGVGQFFNNVAHQAGANGSGSNFVSTSDGIYVAYQNTCVMLDPATGQKLKTFALPGYPSSAGNEGKKAGENFLWGYINVAGDFLVGGAHPIFDPKSSPVREASSAGGNDDTTVPKKESLLAKVVKSLKAGNDNMAASKHMVVMDRHSGKVLWTVSAESGFRHNATCIGGDRLYTIDLPSGQKVRGKETGAARLLAFDLKTGKKLWSKEGKETGVFGTWLSYSPKYDILVEAGRVTRDSLSDESKGIRAYQAKDGKVLWHEPSYTGPAMIHGDTILQGQGGCDLRTGSLKMREDPITGKMVPWRWLRNYGCNTPAASEHLLTFRSGAAGYFDYRNDSGTGNFGGFRSSCTNNLIVAGGVLTAPEYTRTCTCAYQNQTSIGLVHLPQAEMWTFLGSKEVQGPIQRLGINFGAAGDRKAENGTYWIEFPSVAGDSPMVPITAKPENVRYFRRHSAQVEGPMNWVASSGVRGLSEITVPLGKEAGPRTFTVRLFFLEPDRLPPGKRLFRILIQDKEVLANFDIAREGGSELHSVSKEFTAIPAQENLTIRLAPCAQAPVQETILCGIELVAEKR